MIMLVEEVAVTVIMRLWKAVNERRISGEKVAQQEYNAVKDFNEVEDKNSEDIRVG